MSEQPGEKCRSGAMSKWSTRGLSIALAGLLIGCPGPREAPAGRVVILGVDGLDRKALRTLVADGTLPHFAQLLREGSTATMSTWETGLPPNSPPIWTTVATGVLTAAHGIRGFFFRGQDGTRRMLTSDHRRAAAVWQIASAAGRKVGVVNWWFTYPVEEVNGFIVSDRFVEAWARRRAKFWGSDFDRDASRVVYPPSLGARLRAIEFGPTTASASPSAAEKEDRYVFALARGALEQHPDVDLLMVYTRALDRLSHMQWHTHEPNRDETPGGDQIAEYMMRYDGLLGEFLAGLSPADHLLVLSDHGFERSPDPRKNRGASGQHRTKATAHGVFLIQGPRIRRGTDIGTVSVLDVLPTVLELLGVPAATDMPGQVARDAFADQKFDSLPRVARYDRRKPRLRVEPRSEAEASRIDRLRALGYAE